MQYDSFFEEKKTLTAGEIIKELEKYPPETKVHVGYEGISSGAISVEYIEKYYDDSNAIIIDSDT